MLNYTRNAERFMRTSASRLRSQLIHGNLPVRLWGEVLMATSFSLNLCPSRSIRFNCLEYAWQTLAPKIEKPNLPYKRLRAIGCLAYTIPPGHRKKLASRSIKTILVGYEKNSNTYRLWDPKSNRIMVSNDTVFDESVFPLRKLDPSSTEELTILNEETSDEVWDSSISNTADKLDDNPVELPTPPRQSHQQPQPVDRLGDLIGYHSVA